MSDKRELDELSGQYTTGHEWDGIKELDNPTPRWWMWVFVATIVWSIGYWVIYPAWPTLSGYTKGVENYSSREEVMKEIAEAKAAQSQYTDRINASDFSAIQDNSELMSFALAGGRSAFGLHCATCHGSGAQGAPGIPNLNDDDWIWGGKLEDIYTTIRFGVRDEHMETRFNEMPAFVRDGFFSEEDARTIAGYVASMTNQDSFGMSIGASLYGEHCAVCHGVNGEGMQEVGGVRLNDAITFYGNSIDDLVAQISNPKHGMMPSWENRLDQATIKELALYVHSLGGGEN